LRAASSPFTRAVTRCNSSDEILRPGAAAALTWKGSDILRHGIGFCCVAGAAGK